MKPQRTKMECLALQDAAGRSATGTTVALALLARFFYAPRP